MKVFFDPSSFNSNSDAQDLWGFLSLNNVTAQFAWTISIFKNYF